MFLNDLFKSVGLVGKDPRDKVKHVFVLGRIVFLEALKAFLFFGGYAIHVFPKVAIIYWTEKFIWAFSSQAFLQYFCLVLGVSVPRFHPLPPVVALE